MGGPEWLVGVYKGKLVTAGDRYVRGFWKDLPRMRSSPFLEFAKSRVCLLPYFFFLKPARDARLLDKFDRRRYGLPDVAYEAIETSGTELGRSVKGGLKLPAKGLVSGEGFLVRNVPEGLVQAVEAGGGKRGICVLSLLNVFSNNDICRCSRTGTFFRYDIVDAGVLFSPLVNRKGRYLVGKGVLMGAWLHLSGLEVEIGGMTKGEYERELYCPLTVGGSVFSRGGSDLYIAYRGVETDMRLDMPTAFLFLRDAGGFEGMARALGSSVSQAFGRYLECVYQRNVLADGNIVDYADVNRDHRKIKFDIRKDWNALNALVESLFRLFFMCASISAFGEKALDALKDEGKFLGFIDDEDAFGRIMARYRGLCGSFLGGLKGKDRQYFRGLENTHSLLGLALKEGWKDKKGR